MATGLYEHIDCLVTQEEVRRHKPHPDMLVRILELFDTVVDRESVVYVGDTPNDIEAGKRARVLTVGVTYGLSSSDEIRAAAPDEVIDSFDQMRMFLTAPACRRTTATAAQRIPVAEV
jgi:phosphoglycolate phosphatase-like HAD superfamily hydrolase